MRKRHESRLHLLSVRQVQTAGEGDHGDGGGLLLRVRGDSTQFIFRFTAPSGKRREMGLGTCHRGNAGQAGDSLTTARTLAADARAQVRRGLDPIDERHRRKGVAREEATSTSQPVKRATLAWCARDYHERVIEQTRSAKHAAQWISSLENHIPASLWKRPIDEIDAPELLEALCAIRPHERARNLGRNDRLDETVRRIRQRLDAVFEDAIFHKRCTTNPAVAIKRKLREAKVRRTKGAFKALPFTEAPAFITEVRKQPGTAARCLEFAMLTGARTKEATTAEWEEFDLEAAVWNVPGEKMKGAEPHTVHLSPQAVALVRLLQGTDARYVFPSPTAEGKPLSNMATRTTSRGYRRGRAHSYRSGIRGCHGTGAQGGRCRPAAAGDEDHRRGETAAAGHAPAAAAEARSTSAGIRAAAGSHHRSANDSRARDHDDERRAAADRPDRGRAGARASSRTAQG